MSEYMIIDGIKAEINGEKNILELARKVGIEIPAFCYDPELSIYGACRMCMFEDERGRLDAACSTIPKAGMVIKTNTAKLRKYRKMTQEQLSENSTFSRGFIANIESEKTEQTFSLGVLYYLSLKLDIPIELFVKEDITKELEEMGLTDTKK